jgi:hypothetical protein
MGPRRAGGVNLKIYSSSRHGLNWRENSMSAGWYYQEVLEVPSGAFAMMNHSMRAKFGRSVSTGLGSGVAGCSWNAVLYTSRYYHLQS